MHTSISIILIIILFSILFFTQLNLIPTLAYGDTNDTVNISVNVASLSQIALFPSTLSWVGVSAGTEGGSKNITAKNTGSLNLTQIYAFVDTLVNESSRPYGSGNPGRYSAGGVLTIRNETDTTYFYLGRIEWNWTEDIPNHDWTAVTNPLAWGYFTNLTDDYVWILGNNGTTSLCNNATTAQFAIEDHKDLGVITTRTPDKATIHLDSSDENWTYFSINRATSSLYQYCVAAYRDCSKIYIYKFDKRDSNLNESFVGCTGNADYLYDGSGAEGPLMPGSTIILKVDPLIAYGTPSGDLNTTTLTVIAT